MFAIPIPRLSKAQLQHTQFELDAIPVQGISYGKIKYGLNYSYQMAIFVAWPITALRTRKTISLN